MKHFIALIIIFLTVTQLRAQNLVQTIRGTITDQVTQVPLPGVNVIVTGTDPLKGTVTDDNGNFKLTDVPVGKQTLMITYIGYEVRYLQSLDVLSGKELVLHVDLEEKVLQGKEVTVTADAQKNKPLNEMAMVSTRTFSVEETQKFAAAVNDPARMAVSFAGVQSTDDGNNSISIRGNNPNGLQWRMEGVEIPNPNHFSTPGTSGGGISILSSQLLSNSDFMTGAFPAEYGNALSGVFDLRLRKGNNEKREYTLQAGFLGLDASAEGPFKKGYSGSFLVNYRYSTLSAIQQMVDIGFGETNFQDLAFNAYLPAGKAGNFTVFGFGGLSTQHHDADKDSVKWKEDGSRYGEKFSANTGAMGITHSLIVGKDTYIKSSIGASMQDIRDVTTWLDDDYSSQDRFDAVSDNAHFSAASTVTHKFNGKLNLRGGFVVNRYDFTLDQAAYDFDSTKMIRQLNTNGNAYTTQLFTAVNWHLNEKLSVQPGVHYLNFLYNNTQSLEPRLSVKYEFTPSSSFTIGAGMHSQLQPIGVYFAEAKNANGVYQPNKNLGLSKASHLVLSYDQAINEHMHIKTEVYYQQLYNVPVEDKAGSTFSILNVENGYVTDPLVNKGKGRNYGAELTVEQFMHHNFYYLVSASLFNSEYKAMDNEWRSTRFNTGHVLTVTGGKDFPIGRSSKHRTFGINVKGIWTGGMHTTPIDFTASSQVGETKYFENQAFSLQNRDYFRTDVKFSMKRNKEHSTHTLSLDLQNATNQQNIYGEYYNPETGKIKTYYQTPLIPVLSYKVQF